MAAVSAPVEDINTGIEFQTQGALLSSCHDMGFNVYPNPANTYIHINTDQDGSKEIMISDVSGKPVHRTNESFTGSTTLDISDYVAGMYIVKVRNGPNVCYTKFVKQS